MEAFFGPRAAVSLTLKDCDAYRKWRANGGYTWQRGEKLRRSRAGDRCVDIELQTLGNALALAVRQEKLKANPLTGRGRYHSEEDTRHCRETAPTPQQLHIIAQTFRQRSEDVIADCLLFLGFSGLRVREALTAGLGSSGLGKRCDSRQTREARHQSVRGDSAGNGDIAP